MIIAKTLQEADHIQKIGKDGNPMRIVNFFGSESHVARGPQGFLSELIADRVLAPHFHTVDQYQIVARGAAAFGKHEVDPYTVHYVDAFVPYGPITAGPKGMSYFNLRARSDVGAHYMPQQRDDMPPQRAPGRSFTEHTRLRLGSGGAAIQIEQLIPLHDDGLVAYEVVASAGTRLPDELVGGSGRYQLVLGGTLAIDDRTLPVESCVWASAGSVLTRRTAGAEGLHLLQVQLPAM